MLGSDLPIRERLEWSDDALCAALHEAAKLKNFYEKGILYVLVGIGRAIEAHAQTTWHLADVILDIGIPDETDDH